MNDDPRDRCARRPGIACLLALGAIAAGCDTSAEHQRLPSPGRLVDAVLSRTVGLATDGYVYRLCMTKAARACAGDDYQATLHRPRDLGIHWIDQNTLLISQDGGEIRDFTSATRHGLFDDQWSRQVYITLAYRPPDDDPPAGLTSPPDFGIGAGVDPLLLAETRRGPAEGR